MFANDILLFIVYITRLNTHVIAISEIYYYYYIIIILLLLLLLCMDLKIEWKKFNKIVTLKITCLEMTLLLFPFVSLRNKAALLKYRN